MRDLDTVMTACMVGALALVVGCGGATQGSASPDDPQVATSSACSVSQTDVTGVTVTLSSDTCIFHVGEAATFHYAVTVAPSAKPVSFPASPGSGGPSPTTGQLANLVDWRITPDGSQNPTYCADCDTGLGPNTPATTVTLQQGTYDGDVDWPGRLWGGQSDTNNPLGPAFVPGNYDVVAVITGTSTKLAALPIQIVP